MVNGQPQRCIIQRSDNEEGILGLGSVKQRIQCRKDCRARLLLSTAKCLPCART